MNIIEGNILDITEGIICHQVNCKGVAGAGLAKQIRKYYSGWFYEYQQESGMYGNANLGGIGIFTASPKLTIVNMYAQVGYGTDRRYTNYQALRECLQKVRDFAGKRKVYLPKGVGCGLAGGDWQVVSAMIDEILPMAIVVKLK
jgi:O-acetyl-ADP-ribose deacetylase (regulator of RNase III)